MAASALIQSELIPYTVMQTRCKLLPKACCHGCASCCRPSLQHTRHGSSSARVEHTSVACEIGSDQLASKLRIDSASGLICNATCAHAKQHGFSITLLFSTMVGLISSLLITHCCRIDAVTIASPSAARSWSLDPTDAWSTVCMRFVSQQAAHSVSLVRKEYADQYAYGSRSAQCIGCCRLEMICAAALHGLRLPLRSAPGRKSRFSIS